MQAPAIGNSALISHVNHRLILQAVRRQQPTYRAEISRQTHLKPATVTGIVNDLLQAGLLEEIPERQAAPSVQGGRPPMMLQLNSNAMRMLALDLEPDVIRVGLTDLNIRLLEYREHLIDRFSDPSLVIRQIAELCNQVLEAAGERGVDGAAMGLPGLIDREAGMLISSTNMPKWQNVPIRAALEERIGLAPAVERSGRLAALYEDWVAVDEPGSTKLVLSLRTGIGVSLIRGGELYVGSHGFGGEIGHTVVDLNGAVCECGNRGCLETFVSASAIVARARAMLDEGRAPAVREAIESGETLRPELLYQLAKAGDPDCAQIVREVGRYIGIAATNLINIFDPDTLVICGSIDTADDLILNAVRAEVERCALPKIREHVDIRLAAAKERSPLLGAAVLLARDVFALPRLQHPTGAG